MVNKNLILDVASMVASELPAIIDGTAHGSPAHKRMYSLYLEFKGAGYGFAEAAQAARKQWIVEELLRVFSDSA